MLYREGEPGTTFDCILTGAICVLEGTNTNCDSPTGFSAARGWDPVTGWGTLNYGKLVPLFQASMRTQGSR